MEGIFVVFIVANQQFNSCSALPIRMCWVSHQHIFHFIDFNMAAVDQLELYRDNYLITWPFPWHPWLSTIVAGWMRKLWI